MKGILLCGANPNVNTNKFCAYTSIHLVAMKVTSKQVKEAGMHHRLEVMNNLVKRGAKVNEMDKFSTTPLHLAVMLTTSNTDLRIVHSLVQAGADINILDKVLLLLCW